MSSLMRRLCTSKALTNIYFKILKKGENSTSPFFYKAQIVMKKIVDINPYFTHTVLLVLRIAIATLMLVHGIPKLNMLLSGEGHLFPAVMGMSPTLSLLLAVLAEVGCSVLVLVGLGTRVAVIPLMITMLVAVLYVHGTDPFSAKELGLHYVLVYAALLVMGSGRFSVDHILATKLDK